GRASSPAQHRRDRPPTRDGSLESGRRSHAFVTRGHFRAPFFRTRLEVGKGGGSGPNYTRACSSFVPFFDSSEARPALPWAAAEPPVPLSVMDRPVLNALVRELVEHARLPAFAQALPTRARVSDP